MTKIRFINNELTLPRRVCSIVQDEKDPDNFKLGTAIRKGEEFYLHYQYYVIWDSSSVENSLMSDTGGDMPPMIEVELCELVL